MPPGVGFVACNESVSPATNVVAAKAPNTPALFCAELAANVIVPLDMATPFLSRVITASSVPAMSLMTNPEQFVGVSEQAEPMVYVLSAPTSSVSNDTIKFLLSFMEPILSVPEANRTKPVAAATFVPNPPCALPRYCDSDITPLPSFTNT